MGAVQLMLRAAAIAVGATAAGALLTPSGVALSVSAVPDGAGTAGSAVTQAAAATRVNDAAAQLMAAHGCRRDGLPGAIPGSAVIRVDATVRLVSFDRGWAAHEGRAPGTLVAVCPEPLS